MKIALIYSVSGNWDALEYLLEILDKEHNLQKNSVYSLGNIIGYVLNDDTCVMSERGTAGLLDMHHKSLQSMAANWPPEIMEAFCDNSLNVAVKDQAQKHYHAL